MRHGRCSSILKHVRVGSALSTWAAAFAAAVAAHDINSGYVKSEKQDANGQITVRPNKVVMRELLEQDPVFTAEQIEKGLAVREHYQKLLFEQMTFDHLLVFV